ncbi:MAG: hypothetical protein HY073_04605, partial [Deltaproteobacteria bacterium]|nr:hypothetical protein [Deltaproteobacteria bacterium]
PYKGGGERGRSYPKPSGWKFDKERGEIQKLIEVITALRTIRGENRIPIKTEVAPIFYSTDPSTRQLLDHNVEMVMKLTMSQKPSWASEKVKPRKMAHAVLSNLEIFLPLEGLVDIDAEVKRLEKEIGKLKEENDRRQKRLADENFVSRADPEVVEEEKGKLEEVRIKLSRLEETYKNIS